MQALLIDGDGDGLVVTLRPGTDVPNPVDYFDVERDANGCLRAEHRPTPEGWSKQDRELGRVRLGKHEYRTIHPLPRRLRGRWALYQAAAAHDRDSKDEAAQMSEQRERELAEQRARRDAGAI